MNKDISTLGANRGLPLYQLHPRYGMGSDNGTTTPAPQDIPPIEYHMKDTEFRIVVPRGRDLSHYEANAYLELWLNMSLPEKP